MQINQAAGTWNRGHIYGGLTKCVCPGLDSAFNFPSCVWPIQKNELITFTGYDTRHTAHGFAYEQNGYFIVALSITLPPQSRLNVQ